MLHFQPVWLGINLQLRTQWSLVQYAVYKLNSREEISHLGKYLQGDIIRSNAYPSELLIELTSVVFILKEWIWVQIVCPVLYKKLTRGITWDSMLVFLICREIHAECIFKRRYYKEICDDMTCPEQKNTSQSNWSSCIHSHKYDLMPIFMEGLFTKINCLLLPYFRAQSCFEMTMVDNGMIKH